MSFKNCLFVVSLAFLSIKVNAEVYQKHDNYFEIKIDRTFDAEIAEVEKSIFDVSLWWSQSHTYSGKAENLFTDLTQMQCFCEKLPNNGLVKHMSIVNYQPNRLIRWTGGLGPLQSLAVTGVLDFNLKSHENKKTKLTVTYKVSGVGQGLENWVEPVNFVLTEQINGLSKLINGE